MVIVENCYWLSCHCVGGLGLSQMRLCRHGVLLRAVRLKLFLEKLGFELCRLQLLFKEPSADAAGFSAYIAAVVISIAVVISVAVVIVVVAGIVVATFAASIAAAATSTSNLIAVAAAALAR
eukprot:2340636-Pleurochrysis_carterae.AAC.4